MEKMRQIWLWATDAREAATKSHRRTACQGRILRHPSDPLCHHFGTATEATPISVPTHCLRSCRRPCGVGNHQSCRWWQDGPSSRSRTSPSPGSDPDLCQSSDRPDLPGKGREFQLAGGERPSIEREHNAASPEALLAISRNHHRCEKPLAESISAIGTAQGQGRNQHNPLDKRQQAKHPSRALQPRKQEPSPSHSLGRDNSDLSLPSQADGPRCGYRESRGEGKIASQEDAHLYPELDRQHPLVSFCSLETGNNREKSALRPEGGQRGERRAWGHA